MVRGRGLVRWGIPGLIGEDRCRKRQQETPIHEKRSLENHCCDRSTGRAGATRYSYARGLKGANVRM
jgi:hypothetical protein